jgi:hypothetical protein
MDRVIIGVDPCKLSVTIEAAVFTDQSTDDAPALDPGCDIGHAAGLAQRRPCCRLVRPVPVVVPRVLGQHPSQVLLAEDQHMVQALAAQRADRSFRIGARPRGPDRSFDHPRPVPRRIPLRMPS